MTPRITGSFALLFLLTLPGFSQNAPTVEEVAAKWRTAIGAGGPSTAPRRAQTATLSCTSTEDGITGNVVETIKSSGEYHSSVKREFDEAELVLAGATGVNQRRDWNGFVREMRGKELERLRTMALVRQVMVFGPPLNDAMVHPVVSLSDDKKSYLYRLGPDGAWPITWTIDRESGLPTKSERPGEDSIITSYYTEWQELAGQRLPRHIRVTETDKPEYIMECTVLSFTKTASARDFAALKPGPSDVKLDSVVPPIPFTMENNHIVFKVSVNGREPMAFILDTGADQEVIDEKRMASFGLKTYAGTTTTGGGNSAPYSYSKDATFTLPGVTLSRQHVAVIDQTGLERALGVPFGGILGYDFISRFVVEIDYAKKLITLHDPKTFNYKGNGYIVPVTFDNGIPFANGTITVASKTIPAYFVLDSGASETMTLTSPFVKANDLANLAQTNATVNRPAGLEKQFFAQNNVRGHIDRLQLGQMEVRSIPINMSVNTSGAYASENFSGTVGESIFSRYHVFLDYPRNRVIFEPTPEADKPFPERRTYGLSLLASGDDLRTYTVSAVRPDSAAASDGFKKGDVVSALDGKPASQFTLAELRDALSQEGTKHSISVVRNGATTDIAFEVKLVSLDKR